MQKSCCCRRRSTFYKKDYLSKGSKFSYDLLPCIISVLYISTNSSTSQMCVINNCRKVRTNVGVASTRIIRSYQISWFRPTIAYSNRKVLSRENSVNCSCSFLKLIWNGLLPYCVGWHRDIIFQCSWAYFRKWNIRKRVRRPDDRTASR
jgi:hypothetical protein